jgi:filamentous hemagglutinin family protein
MRQAFLWALLLSLALFLIAPAVGDAQEVTTSITSTTGAGNLGTTVSQAGNLYNITGGTRPGGVTGTNLFHSFGDFSVGSGDIANFLNTPVNGSLPLTSNILGRVTGGNVSNIYGTLQTTGFDNANLFLVNPSGIILGPTGSVNVGGSVSMSTANYLRFEGTSTLFDMLSSPASLGPLSVAPVVAFGFLGPDLPTPITVEGSILQVPEGESLSLVGGDITVQSGTLTDGTPQAASLRAPGGQINLVSVASPGEVLVPSFQTDSFTAMGTVTIKEAALLDVSGFDEFGTPIGNGNSGTVFVRGGQLVMDASTIQASTVGAVDGASTAVDIQVSQDVALTTGSAIFTLSSGPGGGGDVQLTADTVTMESNSTIFTGAFNDSGDGIAGDVVLSVREVSLKGGSSIQSQSQSSTPGLGHGNVTIQGLQGAEFGAAESVTLSGGSSLVSTTFSLGDGGQVAITAQSLTMEGPDTTINAATNSEGRGGDIVVRVQHASLLEGATIKTLTGSATPNAPEAATVTVQGLGELKAVSVALSGFGSGIVSETTGSARSGHVTVESSAVSLTDGAVLQTGTLGNTGDMSGGSRISSLSAAENAGQVAINADTLILNNVSIETFTSSSGQAGNVVLNVGTVSLSNGAKINSASSATEAVPNPDGSGTTTAPGAAGNITITAAGGFTSDASTVATSAEANHGGDISITAHSVQLSNGTLITANSNGPLEVKETVLIDGQLVEQVVGDGNAGNITVHSGSTFVMSNSSMTTKASQASGGQILITAPEMVRLTNSQANTTVAGSEADTAGGDIMIDPQFVVLQNSQVLAQAFAGTGGNITIISNVFIADPISLVSASSQLGISGQINIQSPVQNVGEQLTPLSEQFSSAAALLAQQCAARAADGKFSTFLVAPREGLPMEPGGFLASPSWTPELLGSRLSGRGPHTQFSVVTGLFPKHDAKPIQLAKYAGACR